MVNLIRFSAKSGLELGDDPGRLLFVHVARNIKKSTFDSQTSLPRVPCDYIDSTRLSWLVDPPLCKSTDALLICESYLSSFACRCASSRALVDTLS